MFEPRLTVIFLLNFECIFLIYTYLNASRSNFRMTRANFIQFEISLILFARMLIECCFEGDEYTCEINDLFIYETLCPVSVPKLI